MAWYILGSGQSNNLQEEVLKQNKSYFSAPLLQKCRARYQPAKIVIPVIVSEMPHAVNSCSLSSSWSFTAWLNDIIGPLNSP